MNWEFIIKYLPMYERAALLTVKLGLAGVICAIIVGLICAIIQYEKVPVARQIVAVYIELSRNTPLLVQLFFIYYGLPKIGIQTDPQTCGIAGLTFLGGSYMAEAFRSGLETVAAIQTESALSLGMNRLQVMRYVVLPQAFSISVPAFMANVIFLLKETSVFSAVSLMDLVVVGPSGCGKSTLLRCINALEPIQGGVVKLGSEVIDPKSKSLTRLRQKIGMVFQSYDLFPHLTVLDNILLAPTKVQKRSKDEVKEEAMKLLRRVGLEEKAGSYPRELSGGQKQRVAIVRALCMHPEILLFDEVTAALDPEMVREVLDVILDLAAQGRTMIIVTHEMQFARAVADRIIFLEGGKIQEDETPDEFFEHPKTDRAKKFLNTFTFESVKRDI